MKKILMSLVMLALLLTPVYAEPQKKPDLVVDIDASYDNGYIVVNGLMENKGRADALNAVGVKLEIETPSGVISTTGVGISCIPQPCAVLKLGETRAFGFRFLAIEQGVYKLRATIDPFGHVEERSETNNEKTRAVNVR